MRTVSQSDAINSFPALLQQVASEPVAIEADGHNVAYLISPEEFECTREARTKALLQASDALAAEIAENIKRKGLDPEDLMRSLDRKAS